MNAAALCFGLGLSAAVAVGLGRFAYAIVLPAMQSEFAWSYWEAGALNAANSAGYLAGALAASWLGARLGIRRAFVMGTVCSALGLLMTSLGTDWLALLLFRFLPGLFGAIAFVLGGVITARLAASMGANGSTGVGWFYTGPGVGMLAAGLFVSPLQGTGASWQTAWVVLGALALAAASLAVWAVSRVSEESARVETTHSGVSLVPGLVSYAFFAAGYIGYMTFVIAAILERGDSPAAATGWWLLMAVAAIASFRCLGRLLHAARGGALATLNLVCALGAALPLWSDSHWVLALSLVMFSGTFLVIVAATTNMVRLAVSAEDWPRWVGYFTIAFGIGQIVGPLIGGAAADKILSASAVLGVSAGLLLAAAIVALAQKNAHGLAPNPG